MKTIQSKAQEIGNVQGLSEIILIANILINLFKLWWECKHKSPAKTLYNKIQTDDFSLMEKVVLRRVLTKELSNFDLKRRKSIESEILTQAKKLTEEEISEMLNEVKE